VALLVPLLLAGSLAADPRDELKALRNRIRELQQQLADGEASKSEAADALRDSERAISDTNRRLFELGQARRDVEVELKQVATQQDALRSRVDAQQDLLARLLYKQYLAGQSEPMRLLLNRQDPNLLARRMHYLNYVSRSRAELITRLRSDLSQLEAFAAETKTKSIELARLEREQEEQRANLEKEKRSREAVLAKVSEQIVSQRREIGTLKRDAARLTRLMERLARALAAARPPRPVRAEEQVGNVRLPKAGLSGDFGTLKGQLSLPVRGELASRFDSPRRGGGPPWKGILIKSRSGEPVRAVAPGRVVFADWLRGFGNLLILDHGGGYMSLYANNEALYRQVGDLVPAGEPIAMVGRSGGGEETGLYFEIRFQGKPMDPLAWISLQ
jgi:septal ring factor EnvC (AmiA/AmiB activator)